MTGPSSARTTTDGPLSAEDVAEYLRRHPDFLAGRPELLDALTAPAREHGKGVVDLQQFMIERLRGEVERLRASQADLIASARGNMARQSRVHEAVLALLGARTFEDAIQTITTDLAVTLDLDVAALCVEAEVDELRPQLRCGIRILRPGTVDALLGAGKSYLMRPAAQGDPRLYGQVASLIRSDALIRLEVSPLRPPGVLALGTRRAGRFRAGRGTEPLAFLGRVVEVTIRTWLDLPG